MTGVPTVLLSSCYFVDNTRKPSWRKGKRATAVRVWRPRSEEIYSKSTICDFLL